MLEKRTSHVLGFNYKKLYYDIWLTESLIFEYDLTDEQKLLSLYNALPVKRTLIKPRINKIYKYKIRGSFYTHKLTVQEVLEITKTRLYKVLDFLLNRDELLLNNILYTIIKRIYKLLIGLFGINYRIIHELTNWESDTFGQVIYTNMREKNRQTQQ